MSATLRLRPAVLAGREKLAAGRQKLRVQHDAGSPGIQVCNRLTDLVDTVLLDLYQTAVGELGSELDDLISLVPLGGYGRRDMAPFSDVDLMILYSHDAEKRIAPLVKRMNQDIVDAGLTLGSVVRTPEFACQAALKDATIFTSLCEARLLGGSEPLYQRFLYIFRRKAQRRWSSLIEQIEAARRQERSQFGETVYLLQPNVKRSRGALRDIHLLRWVGFARYGESDPDSLMRAGWLSREDRQRLLAAHEFLLGLRNELHFHAGRTQDSLTKPEQMRLADRYGYQSDEIQMAVEKFMRDYFQYTNDVRYIVAHFVNTAKARHRVWDLFGPLFSHQVEGDFRVTPTGIGTTRRGLRKVTSDLAQVLRLMDLANRYNVRIDHPTWQAVRTAMAGRADIEVSREANDRFLSLISQSGPLGKQLRRLHELRVLEKLIPPMAHARGLMQFNEYHKYTVDEHSLRAIDYATGLVQDNTTLGHAYRSIKDKRLLHLALLMHDLGKGYAGDHSIVGRDLAEETAEQLGLTPAETETLCLLIEKHLIMSILAQRRDIHDLDVIVKFAVDVRSLETLQMLYVLTCADLAAVGPGVLNEWKKELLAKLYLNTREYLAGDGLTGGLDERLGRRRGEILTHIGDVGDRSWWRAHVEAMPRRYLLDSSPEQVVAELQRVKNLPRNDAIAWGRWRADRNATEYTVGTYEEVAPGIFHKLTGALTSKRVQILSAEIHTLPGNLVLDRFHVQDPDFSGEPPGERLDEVAGALVAAIKDKSGKPPTFPRTWQANHGAASVNVMLPTEVHIDNNSSDRFTIIDIFAQDRRGLLYAIARTIFELGLSVQLAKIATHVDQVVDVFYVTDQRGGKLRDEQRLNSIRQALNEAIDDPELGAEEITRCDNTAAPGAP